MPSRRSKRSPTKAPRAAPAASRAPTSSRAPAATPEGCDLFEHLPQPAWVYDCETLRFLAVSDSAVRMYGYSREEFLAMTIEEIRPADEVPALRAHLREEQGEAGRHDWHHRRKDGSVFSVQVAAETVTFGGRPARLVIATDVTDRVRAAEVLRESEEHFHLVADNVPAILWSSRADAQSTWVNRQWLVFRGTTEDAELGHGWAEAVHPDDVGPYLKACEEAFGSRRSLAYTFRAQDRHGRWRHLLTRGEPYYGPGGDFLGYLGSCIDVTEQIEATQEVWHQKELLQTIFDHIPVMIAVMDSRGEILTVNRELERNLGYSLEEIRKIDLLAALYPGAEVRAAALAFIHQAERKWGEFPVRIKSGAEVQTAWANVKLSDGTLIGIGQDISERKQLESQLRQAQKMESVGRLAGGIAHDFNNLLTAILGFSSLAARDVPPEGPAHRALEEVRKAGERAASLTRQLLVFSRKQVVMPEVVDLGEVVNDMTGMLRRMIGEDVHLHTDVSDRGATVRIDRGQIEQVLLNLAVNSRDAMPHGGDLTLEVRRVGAAETGDPSRERREGGRVLLTVRDNGVGMDDHVRAHIFEPFFTTKPLGEGTGLGLATVYGIVQQGGGFIEVETEPGQGTTFRISLPWHSRHAPAKGGSDPSGQDAAGHETVLLVEDEESVRRLVAAVLEGSGYRVLAASSGEEALRLASDPAAPIGLILSDLVMPGADGREVVEQIRDLRPELKHLYMSGYTNDAIVRRGIQTGDSPFIQKPFLPAALLVKVREVLDSAGRSSHAVRAPGAPLSSPDSR